MASYKLFFCLPFFGVAPHLPPSTGASSAAPPLPGSCRGRLGGRPRQITSDPFASNLRASPTDSPTWTGLPPPPPPRSSSFGPCCPSQPSRTLHPSDRFSRGPSCSSTKPLGQASPGPSSPRRWSPSSLPPLPPSSSASIPRCGPKGLRAAPRPAFGPDRRRQSAAPSAGFVPPAVRAAGGWLPSALAVSHPPSVAEFPALLELVPKSPFFAFCGMAPLSFRPAQLGGGGGGCPPLVAC